MATSVMPPAINRANIGTGAPGSRTQVTEDDVLQYMSGIRALIDKRGGPDYDENAEDRREYETYLNRALARLAEIEKATGAAPASAAAR